MLFVKTKQKKNQTNNQSHVVQQPTQEMGPEFPERDSKVYEINKYERSEWHSLPG